MGYQPKVLCKNCVHYHDDGWGGDGCKRTKKLSGVVDLVNGHEYFSMNQCKDERRDRFFTTTCGSKGRFYEPKQQTPPNQSSGVSFAWGEPPR